MIIFRTANFVSHGIYFYLNTHFTFHFCVFLAQNRLALIKDWFLKKMLLKGKTLVAFSAQNWWFVIKQSLNSRQQAKCIQTWLLRIKTSICISNEPVTGRCHSTSLTAWHQPFFFLFVGKYMQQTRDNWTSTMHFTAHSWQFLEKSNILPITFLIKVWISASFFTHVTHIVVNILRTGNLFLSNLFLVKTYFLSQFCVFRTKSVALFKDRFLRKMLSKRADTCSLFFKHDFRLK